MTDYHPLIQRAIDGLAKNNGDARRALYERARAALVAQLRSVEPALSEADITKERLALEEAIRKAEADAARKGLGEPRTPSRSEVPSDQRVASPARPFTAERKAAPGGPATALRRESPMPASDSPAAAPSPQRPEPQPPEPAAASSAQMLTDKQTAPNPAKQTARNRILSARTATSLKPEAPRGFRKVVDAVAEQGTAAAKAAPSARGPRDRPRAPQIKNPSPAASLDDPADPHFEQSPFPPVEDEHAPQRALEPDYGLEDQGPTAPSRDARAQPRVPELDEADEEPYRPPRPYRQWARVLVLLIILGGVAAAAWHYRDSFGRVYQFVARLKSQPANQTAQTTAPPPPKFSGRVPQEPVPGEAPAAGASSGAQQQPPQGAQRAVLLEQDPNDPQGKRFPGSVIWRTETVSPGPGLAPELEVRADVVIPERHMAVTLSLRRNTDKALPASHTIQIMFNLPPDFPGDGVSSVPGIFAKNAEEATGTPLAGISVKVTDNYFLLGLSADPTLQQRNVQLLKDQRWFDIAIVYKNSAKAILAVERGSPGDKAFADAFAAWRD